MEGSGMNEVGWMGLMLIEVRVNTDYGYRSSYWVIRKSFCEFFKFAYHFLLRRSRKPIGEGCKLFVLGRPSCLWPSFRLP